MTTAYSNNQANAFGGWTRIDLLLAIYEHGIQSLELALECQTENNSTEYSNNIIAAQKAILAIHAGLLPDEDEVAFNIARLLHFVLSCIENNNLEDGIKILKNMRQGFQAIHDEAVEMEKRGDIPQLDDRPQVSIGV